MISFTHVRIVGCFAVKNKAGKYLRYVINVGLNIIQQILKIIYKLLTFRGQLWTIVEWGIQNYSLK